MSKDQYVAADEAKLDEIIRQAESRLSAQLSLAIAADQRAMTFAGILATGCAALIGWAISQDLDGSRLPAVLMMIVGTMVAAGCALWSASPIAWDIPGNTPEMWIDDIAEGKDDLKSAKAAMADYYADMIAWNSRQMATNANWLRGAMLIIFFTLLAGGIAAVIVG